MRARDPAVESFIAAPTEENGMGQRAYKEIRSVGLLAARIPRAHEQEVRDFLIQRVEHDCDHYILGRRLLDLGRSRTGTSLW